MDRRPYRLNVARSSLVAAIALVLGGCGGGGGDGGSPPGDVNVTVANQDALSRGAALAIQGGFAGSVPIAGGGSGAVLRSERTLALALSRAAVGAASVGMRREHSAALLPPVVAACTVSGSSSTTLDDRDGNGVPGIGEPITVVFNACSDVANEVTDGSLTVTITQVVQTPLSFAADTSLSGFRISLPGRSATYNGSFALSFAQSSANVATTRIAVGSQLVVQAVTPNFNDAITLRAGHTIDSTFDASALPPGGGTIAGRTTTTVSGSFSSASAGGFVSVRTLDPIVQYDVDTFARSGRIEVLGKTGSLQATVLSPAQVRIDLDANGDGAFDATKTVTWDFLL